MSVLYGLCEGPRIGKRFEQQLAASGFTIIRDALHADILITHSGGCFAVPRLNSAQLIVIIGLPYSPDKPFITVLASKVWLDYKHYLNSRSAISWVRKTFWNLVYFWRMPNNFRMLSGLNSNDWRSLKNVVLIRNYDDAMSTVPNEKIPFTQTPKIIELPGQHDDCWLHPVKYVDIIKSYYGQGVLAQTSKR